MRFRNVFFLRELPEKWLFQKFPAGVGGVVGWWETPYCEVLDSASLSPKVDHVSVFRAADGPEFSLTSSERWRSVFLSGRPSLSPPQDLNFEHG